jgi:hypothetical protein
MAKSDKKKPSSSSQPNTAALVTVPGSPLDFYTNSNHLAFVLPKFGAAQNQGKLGSNDIDDDLSEEEEEESEEEELESEEGEESDEEKTGRPSLSDIQVISNEIVFDAANNPTAKIVFKVKNSSGVELKAIDVRVEKK